MSKDTLMKVLLWAIPVVFGAGGFWALMTSTSSQLTHEVAEVQVELEEHAKLEAHPVGAAKMEIIQAEVSAIRTEQAQQAQSLAAICQATDARCR